jgi:hypothetical protein
MGCFDAGHVLRNTDYLSGIYGVSIERISGKNYYLKPYISSHPGYKA